MHCNGMYRSGHLHYPRNISGLEESDSGVWKLFLAIAIHGSAIAFCIGTEMVTTGDFVKKILQWLKHMMSMRL